MFKIDDNQVILQTNPKEIESLLDMKDSSILGYKSFDFMDIDSTIPFINDSQVESYTPQMLSLDLLNGVSFSKGCYPGQEIVARTHYLGEAKKSLCKITFASNVSVFAALIILSVLVASIWSAISTSAFKAELCKTSLKYVVIATLTPSLKLVSSPKL